MKRKRYTEEQRISILKEAESGVPPADLCRKHGMAGATFYAWKRKYGGMEVSEAKRLRALEDENARLKKLVAELALDNQMLKAVSEKSGEACGETRGGALGPNSIRSQRASRVSHRGAASVDTALRRKRRWDSAAAQSHHQGRA